MLNLLLAGLLLAPAPVTSLDVAAPDPPTVRAGEPLQLPVNVSLTGPTGPLPGLAGPVDLELSAPDPARCSLADEQVALDPLTGRARTSLDCRPRQPGTPTLSVTARSPPHAPDSWNEALPVEPDRLTGSLALGEPDGYRIPYEASLAPEHLDGAEVRVRWTGDLDGSPLAFDLDPRTWTIGPGSLEAGTLAARHGAGTYEIGLHADGPRVEPSQATETVRVSEPPRGDNLTLDVGVGPGLARVNLTGDSVNDDGKNKRPGDELITRLTTEHADRVRVEVQRPVDGDRVPLAAGNVTVDANGDAEHRFSHPVLPAGPLVVRASAGNSTVARTARIEDVGAEADVTGPAAALADGRSLDLDLRLADPNFGSTPLDPGPVFGLPDLTWRVFDGSHVVDGWRVSIGPFEGGPEGQATTSRIPWPEGTAWANATDGAARMPLTVTPPPDVEPDDYRVSLYDADGDRVGGASFEFDPAPTVALDAGPPRPGEPWLVRLDVADTTETFHANLTVRVDGREIADRTLASAGNRTATLPGPLPAGTNVSVEARGHWPGRPPSHAPDARLVREVPDLAPRLSVDPILDGVPTPPPLAVHPAHGHGIELQPSARDPNGDPVEVSARVVGPDGADRDWVGGDPSNLTVPPGVGPGRYEVELEATSPSGTTRQDLALDVGSVTRLRLDGPSNLALREGGTAETNLTVRNAGTVAVDVLVLAARNRTPLDVGIPRGSEGLVPAGEPIDVDLAPGTETQVPLQVSAPPDARGNHSIELTVAGGSA